MDYPPVNNQAPKRGLSGTLMALGIYQVFQIFFYIFVFILTIVMTLNTDYEYNKIYMPRGYRAVLILFSIAILVAFTLSTIFIFMKKKAGIFLSWTSIVLQIMMHVYWWIALTVFIESHIDEIGEDHPYPIGGLAFVFCLSMIFWAVHIALLVVPPSRKNVKEVFN